MEHRYNPRTGMHESHGVFFYSAAAADVLLLTPPKSDVSLVQYRAVGGTLDFYFFAGPTPQRVVEQYGELIGFPAWQPAWGFGFHLCRWGTGSLNRTKEQVRRMREADIPLEGTSHLLDVYVSQLITRDTSHLE
jgi:alpha-glucosidase